MASMRDIKRRKDSIQSTQQITKAMKLVSTVKLQRARSRAENARPYFDKMYETIQSILAKSERLDHPFLTGSGSERKAVIVVTSNRGLAGGYNNNIARLIRDTGWSRDQTLIYGIGHKAMEILAHQGYQIVSDDSDMINEPEYEDARKLGDRVLRDYENGRIGEIYLAYTEFKSTVVHQPRLIRLLPIEPGHKKEEGAGGKLLMNFEPQPEELLSMLIPKYVCSMIYGALAASAASENGARMQAMDSASSNAEEMISELELAYNRARQGAITQELTEIISGAEALK